MKTDKINLLKQPPHAKEAEAAVISALLRDNDVWNEVDGLVVAADFFDQSYRLIFQAIEELAGCFAPFDTITVIEKLRNNNELASVSGETPIYKLMEQVTVTENIKTYTQMIRDKSILRQLIEAGERIIELGYSSQQNDIKMVLDLADHIVFNLTNQYADTKCERFNKASFLAAQTLKKIQELSKNDSMVTGLPTGWRSLDELTTGIHAGELIVVAARPAMGKTTFALNIAANIALKCHQNVAYFSLGMSGEQLIMKLMSALGEISQGHLHTGNLLKEEWIKLKEPANLIANAPVFIDDTSGLSLTEMRLKCRRLILEKGHLGLVVVDYLQLMEIKNVVGDKKEKQKQIAEIFRDMKLLAMELNCPIIVLSQLDRIVENRPNKRPTMSDLHNSWAIEQNADMVMFIYRDAVYADEDIKRQNDKTAEIILGKRKNGSTGTVELTFIEEYARFIDHMDGFDNEVPF